MLMVLTLCALLSDFGRLFHWRFHSHLESSSQHWKRGHGGFQVTSGLMDGRLFRKHRYWWTGSYWWLTLVTVDFAWNKVGRALDSASRERELNLIFWQGPGKQVNMCMKHSTWLLQPDAWTNKPNFLSCCSKVGSLPYAMQAHAHAYALRALAVACYTQLTVNSRSTHSQLTVNSQSTHSQLM